MKLLHILALAALILPLSNTTAIAGTVLPSTASSTDARETVAAMKEKIMAKQELKETATEKAMEKVVEAPTKAAKACIGFGPQTPRDIDSKAGSNTQAFSTAPSYDQLNLCNLHFHTNAEHKAKDFSISAGDGHEGHGGGYKCNMTSSLTADELKPLSSNACKGAKAGDTVEFHWVHSSCDVAPGKSLGACLSDKCANPALRVETQVFLLVNDANALNFNDFNYTGKEMKGYHQADALPSNTGVPVEFLGSTTGPKYTEQTCSPLQVTWSVRPACAKLDINSLSEWCKGNSFEEDHAHGVRKLVTDASLLSTIE